MDKAIVIGAFHFLGFHICNSLLNKGIEVTGILFNEMDKIPFLEEKRMEIGRNSNFQEQSKFDIGCISDSNTAKTLIFSYYDFFMLHRESLFVENKVRKPIMDYIEHQNQLNLVLLLPMPMQIKGIDEKGHLIDSMRKYKNVQVYYLPSIYGPWQPSTFLFQRMIRSKFDNKVTKAKSTREWTKDIIFVDDAVETLIEQIEEGSPGNFLLESGEEHYWEVCAGFLQAEEWHVKNKNLKREEPDSDIITVSVKKLSPVADSLSSQIEHERWLYHSSMMDSDSEGGSKGN